MEGAGGRPPVNPTPDSRVVTQDDIRNADVISQHLPSGYAAHFDAQPDDSAVDESTPAGVVSPPRGSADNASNAGESVLDQVNSSLKLQGGDIHRDLYKIDNRVKPAHRRAATYSYATWANERSEDQMPVQDQLAPGGFRREFIRQRRGSFLAERVPITSSFVEFLDLYGSFAGEDLHDSDDETESQDDRGQGERRPLLGRRRSSRFKMRQGDASTAKTFFTLLKAFIGTGIMFLPKAFNNGGILFSSITLIVISCVTMLTFHLLLKCKHRYSGGYGEIGEAIGGKLMQRLILGSITISQIGFVCAGMVFVAENLYAFLEAVAKGDSPLSTNTLIALQVIILVPMAFIRKISKLGPAALLADVFILIGLTYIYYFDISTIADRGIHKTVTLFNPEHFTLTIGASVFTFEGIGLILPIESSMKKPQHFEPLLAIIMLIVTVIFTSVGVFCYATFGDDTKIEILNNYPQSSKLVQAVTFLYSMAVLVGTPVQLFPALRIIEVRIFGGHSGKKDALTKWKKNGYRTVLAIACGVISILGANDLDRFVSLIGSFACIPLVYIYPPWLHYKGIAERPWAKAADITLMVFGFVTMAYTTFITIVNSFL